MARLLADENFPGPVAGELRWLGHDVVSLRDRGQAGTGFPDEAVLALATREDRAVLTRDRRDFIRLHRAGEVHAGVIVCTVDSDFVGQAARIHAAIKQAGDLHSQLIRVNRPSQPGA